MIDKRLLNDSIEVYLKQTVNEYGDETYQSKFDVDHVRIDRDIRQSTSGKNLTDNHVSTIFIYPRFNDCQVDDEWLGAKIFDGMYTYRVVGYRVNYLGNRVFSYEVEVV